MDELIARYDELRQCNFMVQMCDHWSREDYLLDTKQKNEMAQILAEIKAKLPCPLTPRQEKWLVVHNLIERKELASDN